MAKLEIALLAGAESKNFLLDLTTQIDRLEKITKSLTDAVKKDSASLPPEEDVDTDDDSDFEEPKAKSKPPKKKESNSFDDEDEEDEDEIDEAQIEETEIEEGDDFEAEEPPKKRKAKKVTIEDCNDAAKELAKSKGREKVLALMTKHFKTRSVSEVKADDYAKFVEVMKGAL